MAASLIRIKFLRSVPHMIHSDRKGSYNQRMRIDLHKCSFLRKYDPRMSTALAFSNAIFVVAHCLFVCYVYKVAQHLA